MLRSITANGTHFEAQKTAKVGKSNFANVSKEELKQYVFAKRSDLTSHLVSLVVAGFVTWLLGVPTATVLGYGAGVAMTAAWLVFNSPKIVSASTPAAERIEESSPTEQASISIQEELQPSDSVAELDRREDVDTADAGIVLDSEFDAKLEAFFASH